MNVRKAAERLGLGIMLVAGATFAFAVGSARDGGPPPFIEETASPGVARTHTLPLAAGRYAKLRLERTLFDVDLLVRDSAGTVVLRAGTITFPPGPCTFSLLSGTAAETYRLEATVAPGGATTTYSLRIVEERDATPGDADYVAAEHSAIEGDRLRIAGTADSLREARKRFERALAVAREGGHAVLEADAMTGVARVRDSLGEKTAALEILGQALERQQALGRTVAAGYVRIFMANIHDHLGTRPKAQELLTEAIAAGRAVGDRRLEGIALNQLGMVHYHLGEHTRALELWDAALPAHAAAGNPRGEAQTLGGIGTLYDVTGERDKALDYLQRGLKPLYAVGDPRDLAIALNNIGAVHRNRGDSVEALDFYSRAREKFRESGDRSAEGASIHNLAQVHEMRGDFQQSIALYHEAIAIFAATESPVREANSRTALANLYAVLGDHTRALALLEQALPVHRQNGNRAFEGTASFYMANLLAARKDFARALPMYEEALRLQREVKDRRGQAGTLRQTANLHLKSGDAAKALAVFGETLALDRAVENRRGEAMTLAHMALAHAAAGSPDEARRAAEEARRLARTVGDPKNEAFGLYVLARLSRAHDPAAARDHAEQALALVESMRSSVAGFELRASFLAALQDYFELTVDVLMTLHRRDPAARLDALAFETNERARARSLLDRLADARADIREGVDAALVGEERRVQHALNAKAFRYTRLPAAAERSGESSALSKEIDELAAKLRDLQGQIRAKSPRYALLTQPQTLTAAEVAGQLDADTVLLEYALGEERSHLWLVARDSFLSFTLPPRAEIETLAGRFMQSVAKDAAADAEAAEALARVLFGPIAEPIAGRRLVIVADGALQSLPMAALPVAGAPLLARHEVVMLPSASTLALLRGPTPRPATSRTVMVLADPVFDPLDPRVRAAQRVASARSAVVDPTRAALDDTIERGGLGRLLGSRREAAAILSMARAGEARQAVDFEASRTLATGGELARYRIVHFATHGVLDAARPELSGLVLSLVDREGRPDDGFLRLHDIYNLPLAADLVVLSACQTGLGRDVRGEGLVGLTRGFMYAGAPRVVASLWKVDDRATAELMRRFYAEMLGPRALPAAAALRAAQLSLQQEKRWSAPYYWAGFALQGEWR